MIEPSEAPEGTIDEGEATISLKGALALIDQGLGGLTDRQLVSASEVTDLLLDVRSLIAASV